jgi:hypothetical protein
VLGKINIQPLINCYVSGGAASYHPGMLLKVMVYATSITFTVAVRSKKHCSRIFISCGLAV